MATNALHALWAEPRPTNAPDRGPRDWALVAALVGWSVIEVLLRADRAWAPLVVGVSVVVAASGGAVAGVVVAPCLLWGPTRPRPEAPAPSGPPPACDTGRLVAMKA